jgi:hypothetical protein
MTSACVTRIFVLSYLIFYNLVNCTTIHASNRAGALTCEVMEDMFVLSLYIALLAKFPRQHGCWRTRLLSTRKHIKPCFKSMACCLIFIIFFTYTTMRASNRAGALLCEVMECMLVFNKYN